MLFSSLHAGPPDTWGRASTSSTLIQVTLGSSRENSFVLRTFRVSPSEPVHESWVKRLGRQHWVVGPVFSGARRKPQSTGIS